MSAIEERTFIWAGYAVIVIVVFLSLFAILNNMADNTGFKQKVYAGDLAFIEGILLTNDYDYEISINSDPDFEYEFSDCKISVKKEGSPDKSAAEYFCADNLNIEKFYDIGSNTKMITFRITDDQLKVAGELDE